MPGLDISLSPLLFEKLGIIDSKEDKAAKLAEKTRIGKSRVRSKVALGLQTLFPENPVTDPKVSLNLLEGGATVSQMMEMARKLSPENPDELTSLMRDAALRVAQNDPTLTKNDRLLGQGFLSKEFGFKGAAKPAKKQEFNTVDEVAIGFALENLNPEEYSAAIDAVIDARERTKPAGARPSGQLSQNQRLEQAKTTALSRISILTKDAQSYEPVIDGADFEGEGGLQETNPEEASRYFKIKGVDQYTAYKPEVKQAIDDANEILINPARKQALADSIGGQQPTVASGQAGQPTDEISVPTMLQELNQAGFNIAPEELQDPAAQQQLRIEYQKWVSGGRRPLNGPQ